MAINYNHLLEAKTYVQQVPVPVYVDKPMIVEKPTLVYVDKPVFIDRPVVVEKIVEVEKVVERVVYTDPPVKKSWIRRIYEWIRTGIAN